MIDYAGIPAMELPDAQLQKLVSLIELYVGNMDDGHARVKMKEVLAHMDQTYFAWIGKTEPGSVFYYRIQSPVIVVEFDHQRPVGMRHLLDPDRADHRARAYRRANAQRQRLWQGSAAAALRTAAFGRGHAVAQDADRRATPADVPTSSENARQHASSPTVELLCRSPPTARPRPCRSCSTARQARHARRSRWRPSAVAPGSR